MFHIKTKTIIKISGIFNNIVANIKNNSYYENVVDFISKTTGYGNSVVSVAATVAADGNDGENNSGADYEPVMLVRTRSNSIYSNGGSNDDGCEYDVMTVVNHYHLTQYEDWVQYGILPNPKELSGLRETCCSLCGKEDENKLHYKFFSGCSPYIQLGYNICFLCKFKFEIVIKKRAEAIWSLLDNVNVPYVWAPRTRRDPVTNERIYEGRYTYEKWIPQSKYVSFMTDNTKGYPGIENTPFIFCSMQNAHDEATISKLIPVVDILKSNYNACKSGLYDTTYNPNVDDPINTLILSPDAKINLRY